MLKPLPYIIGSLIAIFAVILWNVGFNMLYHSVPFGPLVYFSSAGIILLYIVFVIALPKLKNEISRTMVFHFRMSVLMIPITLYILYIISNIL